MLAPIDLCTHSGVVDLWRDFEAFDRVSYFGIFTLIKAWTDLSAFKQLPHTLEVNSTDPIDLLDTHSK